VHKSCLQGIQQLMAWNIYWNDEAGNWIYKEGHTLKLQNSAFKEKY